MGVSSIERLLLYLKDKSIKYNTFTDPEVFQIGTEKFLYVCEKSLDRGTPVIFHDNLDLAIDEREEALYHKYEVDYFAFEFGGYYYYSPDISLKLNKLLYLGQLPKHDFPCLGVHDHYELLNSIGSPSIFTQKAVWAGYQTIAQINRHTLAGSIYFYKTCKAKKIDPILGMSVCCKIKGFSIDLKLYCCGPIGWENLIIVSNVINLDNDGEYISFEDLCLHSKEIILVVDQQGIEALLNNRVVLEEIVTQGVFTKRYCQVDFSVKYKDDKNSLELIQQYFIQIAKTLPPVLITDCYQTESEQTEARIKLRAIAKHPALFISSDVYLKTVEEIRQQFDLLFQQVSPDRSQLIWDKITNNAIEIAQLCKSFELDFNTLKLPSFNFSEHGYSSSNEMLEALVMAGYNERKIGEDENFGSRNGILQVYLNRINEELTIIKEGGFADYFLIVWDIYNFCYNNGILVGVGRGSVGGSLVAYFLKITHIDPIKYKLLFSRFLNKGRMQGSLPDIDSDIASSRREEVRQYIRNKYGADRVCNIGTFQTLQLRAAIKDLARHSVVKGAYSEKLDLITSLLFPSSEKQWQDCTPFESLFISSLNERKVKAFIKDNYKFVNIIKDIVQSPKTYGIHACAMVITPQGKSIRNHLPLRRVDDVLISTWEFDICEKMGFLKEDILGLRQLDKTGDIIKLIQERKRIVLNVYDLEPDDPQVLSLFEKGYVQDVFHFGSEGLSNFVKTAKPSSFEDLITMIALFRPGPMESSAHLKWIDIKNGEDQPQYDWGCEEITKNTYSLVAYQEQVMEITASIADLTEIEADDVRRAMGKKELEKLKPYKDRFIEKAIKKGCEEWIAVSLWEKLEAFAGYAFNRSHAAAYAKNAYISNYLKFYYPIEFWTVALHYSSSPEETSHFISEMRAISKGISLVGIDINKSQGGFSCSENEIYWGLESIKGLGGTACVDIITERTKNGKFYSVSEFFERMQGTSVKSNTVRALILCGAFDSIHSIKVYERPKLIKKFYNENNRTKQLEEFEQKTPIPSSTWALNILQRELCGFGEVEYKRLIVERCPELRPLYIDFKEIPSKEGKSVCLAGIVNTCVIKPTKVGQIALITLTNNDESASIVLWSECVELYKQELDCVGKILVLSGLVKFDNVNDRYSLYSDRKTVLYVIKDL